MTSPLQNVILDVFREVHALCERHNFRYFAIGGTAIGAVRHEGFVPWDDDLDIAMPIEDYIQFLDVAKNELSSHLELFTYKDSIHNSCIFAKVIDSQTTLIERKVAPFPDRYTGVWVDVMPMSGVPGRGVYRVVFCEKVKWLDRLNGKARMPLAYWKKAKSKALGCAIKPCAKVLGVDWLPDKWMNLLVSHPFDQASHVGYTWDISLSSLVFPKEWFNDYLLVPFEDTEIRLPIGYDDYLQRQFGNYLVPPDDQGRETHDCFVDLDHSYLEYMSGRRELPSDYYWMKGCYE